MRHDPWADPVRDAGKAAFLSAPWKTSEVALGIVLAAVLLVALAAVYAAFTAEPFSGVGIAVVGGGTGIILVLTAWAIGPRRHGVSLASLGLVLPAARSFGHLILLPLAVLGGSLAFTAVYAGLLSLVGWELPQNLPEEFQFEGSAAIGGLAFVAVLWGPLAEEVFFRGFVFGGLMGRLGYARALLITSLLFALFHVEPRLIVPIFVTGMLLAWVYHRTGSMWSPFLVHALQNAVAFSISTWG